MSGRTSVRVTQNFERNLDAIEQFLGADAPSAFQALLTPLFDTAVPNLERFPEIGADLLARRPESVDGAAQIGTLRERLGKGASIREYVLEEYLILYACMDSRVFLLSIKHHRQLSFDLPGHWSR